MAQEKIIIKFEPQGDKKLIAAINRLSDAQGRLLGSSQQYSKQAGILDTRNKRLAKTNSTLSLSFATLRSKMLLATFAMGMGGRQAVQMVKDFARVEAMSVAFDTLSGGVGNAQIALGQLSKAVGGTMSKMDLLQSSNNALILGVAKSSHEMNTMFGVAVKLGRAVGRTAKDSVDSLVTGIGRQSRMMLDNIGIIMDTEKAYASYAAKLGVTVESLNDTERRQAFLNATLEAAKEKADMLGDSVETLQSRLESAGASWDDLKVAAGGLVKEFFGLETKITRSAEVFDLLTKAMDKNQELTKKDWFIAKDNAIAVLKLLHRVTHGYNKEVQEQNFAYREQADAIVDVNDEHNILFKVKKVSQEQETKMRKLVTETTSAKLRYLDALIDEVKESRIHFETTQDQLDVLAMLEKQYNNLDPSLSLLEELYKNTNEAQIELIKTQMHQIIVDSMLLDGNKDNVEILKKMADVYAFLQGKLENLHNKGIPKVSDEVKVATRLMNNFSNALANAAVNGTDMGVAIENALKRIAATIVARMAVFSIASFLFPNLKLGTSALRYGLGLAHEGGLIGDNGKIQRFATGGTIQGGDNVPILAQGGEFVMQRSAVESIGIENLNRMNQGGGASITVNVSGNVLTQDFVEEELAGAIRDAARRGTDFGIS